MAGLGAVGADARRTGGLHMMKWLHCK